MLESSCHRGLQTQRVIRNLSDPPQNVAWVDNPQQKQYIFEATQSKSNIKQSNSITRNFHLFRLIFTYNKATPTPKTVRNSFATRSYIVPLPQCCCHRGHSKICRLGQEIIIDLDGAVVEADLGVSYNGGFPQQPLGFPY